MTMGYFMIQSHHVVLVMGRGVKILLQLIET